MPAGKDNGSDSSGSGNSSQRTTFRPPWVKEGPPGLPVPAAPWSLKNTRRNSNTKDSKESENPLAGVQLRKTSITSKEPQENGASKENSFKKPQLKPVPPKDEAEPSKNDHKLPPVKLNSVAERIKKDAAKKPPLQRMPTAKDEEIDRAVPAARHALVREESMRKLSLTPAPPPMPPPAPALPPGFAKKDLNKKQQQQIEQLKSRPKVRPDWSNLLKEIEDKKKLKHVECNDRSQPLLPSAKTNVESTEHFLYESETPNVHNELLKQIQGGLRLKSVKTNDRSKPILEGLRKFRRQMTIEEQIQKSVSMASMPPELQEEIAPEEADEMDDIDKVRDDLQSTKQMLALELRNKEAQIRENKRLLSRIQNLEAELEKEKSRKDGGGGGGGATTKSTNADDKLIQSLKKEAEQARKTSEEVEKKYKDVSEQLDTTKLQLEEMKKQNQQLERKVQETTTGKRQSFSQGGVNGQESEDEIIMSDLSEESDGEETEEKKERRALRELKIVRNKLRNFKNKEDNAKKERTALREIMKRHQTAIKDEKKKFKVLQKEVDKMAALMKDVDEDDEDEDEEKDDSEEEEEEEEEEESSEESESEESDDDSDSERSQSEPEDAPIEKKKANLNARSNRHENILAALKKGNLIMKTNAERLQDDLNKQKEATAGLQHDLDSVLAELG